MRARDSRLWSIRFSLSCNGLVLESKRKIRTYYTFSVLAKLRFIVVSFFYNKKTVNSDDLLLLRYVRSSSPRIACHWKDQLPTTLFLFFSFTTFGLEKASCRCFFNLKDYNTVKRIRERERSTKSRGGGGGGAFMIAWNDTGGASQLGNK